MNLRDSSGQVLLIVVLVTVVALTIGLSVVSRSVTNLEISKQNEESQRAFQAAEAGVEQALNAIRLSPTPPSVLSDDLSNESRFTTELTVVDGQEFLLNGGEVVEQDIGMDVWLSKYPDYADGISDTVTVYWNSSDQISCDAADDEIVEAAVQVLLLSGNVFNPTFNKYLFDGCGRVSGASSPGGGRTIDGVTLTSSANITVRNGLIMKVIPLYNSSIMAVRSNSVALPTQGSLIESVGSSGESERKIVLFQSYPQIPTELFQYSILSQ